MARSEDDGWSIEQATGYTLSHGVYVRDPNCAQGRHPTRNCRCAVFRSLPAAKLYIAEQRAEAEAQAGKHA
jgi:hypothetical protein